MCSKIQLCVILAVFFVWGLNAQEDTALAQAANNPLANMISVPFQDNLSNDSNNTLNIQPLIPIDMGEDVLFITRPIVPVVTRGLGNDTTETKIGQTNWQNYFTNKKPIALGDGALTLGLGPGFILPAAQFDTYSAPTDNDFGMGVSLISVYTQGGFMGGFTLNNNWSVTKGNDKVENDGINLALIQYFASYTFPSKTTLISAPYITANWNAANSKDVWTVPFGLGVSQLVMIAKQPISLATHAYYNVAQPSYMTDAQRWSFRFQASFLFPQKG